MAQRKLKIDKSLADDGVVPIVCLADRGAPLEALRTWAQQLEAASDWMRQAILWPTEKFWSTLVYVDGARELLGCALRIIPRVYDPDERARLLSVDITIANSVRRLHQTSLVFFLRIAVHNRQRDPSLTEKEYVQLIFERRLLPMRVIARAVAALAPAEDSTTDKLMIKVIKELIRLEVRYKDDIRTVVDEHKQTVGNMESDVDRLVSAFNKSRGDSRVRCSRLVERYLCEIVDHMYSMKRFMQVCKETGLRMEPKKFITCIPSLVDAVHKYITTELIFDSAMYLEEYPLRRFFRLRTQFETYSAELFLFGLECSLPDQVGSIVQGVLTCERFIFILDELKPLDKIFVHVSPEQKEYLMNGVKSIRESQKRKLAQDLERMGMLKNLGDPSAIDPGIQKSIEDISGIFPHLSPQYVHLCLRHFGYDQAATLDGLLNRDESLPLTLRRVEGVDLSTRGLPQSMPTLSYFYEDFSRKRVSAEETDSASPGPSSSVIPKTDSTNSFKGLFSLAPPVSVKPASEVTVKKEDPNPFETDVMLKLRAAVDRLKLRAIGQEDLTNKDGPTEKLVQMSRSKKYCNTETFKVPEADKVALRPFYDKYKYETPDSEENLYDDEYDDAFEDKAFSLEPVGGDNSPKVVVKEEPVARVEQNFAPPRGGGNQRSEMVVGSRTGKSMPKGALSGKGRGGGNAGYQNRAPAFERNSDVQNEREIAPPPGFSQKAPPPEQAPPPTQETTHPRGNTSYTGGRDRQWKEKHKNDQKRRGADRKMNKMGI